MPVDEQVTRKSNHPWFINSVVRCISDHQVEKDKPRKDQLLGIFKTLFFTHIFYYFLFYIHIFPFFYLEFYYCKSWHLLNIDYMPGMYFLWIIKGSNLYKSRKWSMLLSSYYRWGNLAQRNDIKGYKASKW